MPTGLVIVEFGGQSLTLTKAYLTLLINYFALLDDFQPSLA
jgi:hypothetical protein